MKRILWLLIIFLIAGCGSFEQTDVIGTLNADSIGYETQVAQIDVDRQLNETAVMQTVVAAETQVAEQSTINRQILQTISAGSTPTVGVVRSSASQSGSGQTGASSQVTAAPFNAAQQSFSVTGTSTSVDSADGCMINSRSTFATDEDQVYMTARAFNLAQGTLMAVEWMRDGAVVWEDTWTVDSDYADICVWFYLIPSYVPFTAGTWSAQLYADNTPIGESVQFFFEEM